MTPFRSPARAVLVGLAMLMTPPALAGDEPARVPKESVAKDERPDAKVDEILARWEAACHRTDLFEITFHQTQRDVAAIRPKEFEGRLLIRGDGCFDVTLAEVAPADPKPIPRERTIVSNKMIYIVYPEYKKIRSIDMVNPFSASGFGDFVARFYNPFRHFREIPLFAIFRMRRVEALERFQITLLKQASGVNYLRFVPKRESDRYEFVQFVVMLDGESGLPKALRVYAPNGKDTKTFEFSSIDRPAMLPEDAFDGEALIRRLEPEGYRVTR